jgi:hypothetical protein
MLWENLHILIGKNRFGPQKTEGDEADVSYTIILKIKMKIYLYCLSASYPIHLC